MIDIKPKKYTAHELARALLELPDVPIGLNGCDCGGDEIWVAADDEEAQIGYDAGYIYNIVISEFENKRKKQ